MESHKEKEFKLKDLKKALDKMSQEELDKPILYHGQYSSGVVLGVGKSKSNFYWDGSDDPCELQTLSQLKGYDKEYIEDLELVIRRGDFVIKIN